MTGLALAELLKWPAIVLGVLALIFGGQALWRRRTRKAAKNEAALETIQQGEESRREADASIRDRIDDLMDDADGV